VSRAELVVVGAGPAGMNAALAAADAGGHVELVDAAARPGGQYYRQLPAAFRATHPGALHHDFAPAQAWFAALAGHPRIRLRPETTVWAAEPGPGRAHRLHLRTGDRTSALTAGAVVVATGAYDRALPFPGWDLPGVLTAGGMQALLKGQRMRPGRRIALSGTGPFLLPVATALAESGAEVAGVFEAAHPRAWLRHLSVVPGQPGRLREGFDYLRTLRRYRVPVRFGSAVVAAHGEDSVVGASVARLRGDWSIAGTERIDVDAIGVGYGFVPVLDLVIALGAAATPAGTTVDSWQRTTAPGVFAAGEATGIGGAALAAAEGRLAGLAASVHLGWLTGTAAERLGGAAWRARRRYARFAGALRAVYPVRDGWRSWLRPETLVCRCEEVPLSTVEGAVDELGLTDLRSLKLVTRVGMGMCQGRVCGPAVAELLRAGTGRAPADPLAMAARPLAVPVPLDLLASVEDPP
jgi:thioredoxin reductase